MRFRGNQPATESPGRDHDLEQIYPSDVEPKDVVSIEDAAQRENRNEDEANVEELEQTARDYWGRSGQETDGAVPSEPPDSDPLPLQFPRKPKGPPEHNM